MNGKQGLPHRAPTTSPQGRLRRHGSSCRRCRGDRALGEDQRHRTRCSQRSTVTPASCARAAAIVVGGTISAPMALACAVAMPERGGAGNGRPRHSPQGSYNRNPSSRRPSSRLPAGEVRPGQQFLPALMTIRQRPPVDHCGGVLRLDEPARRHAGAGAASCRTIRAADHRHQGICRLLRRGQHLPVRRRRSVQQVPRH
jgi:hypothetical protein